MKKNIEKILLFLIIIIGFSLRVINIDWDKGYIFHPDERAIVMNATSLSYPKNLSEFLSPESNFNTNFFAYGNLPIYILKFTGDIFSQFNDIYSQYSGIYIIGRLLNVFFSTLTIILVFIYSKKLFNTKIALLSSFFFSIAAFPIQNAHFFTVDTLLTFFILLALFFLNLYYEKPSIKMSVLIGISLGLCLATKISSLPIIFTIFLFIIILELIKRKKIKKIVLPLITRFTIITLFALVVFVVSQPYSIIDYENFFNQIIYQSKMGTDPFVFPYTLQYVGKINFYYEIKNILFWGLGIPLGALSIIGFFLLLKTAGSNIIKNVKFSPILFFTASFFIFNASYAVGWMRYLLPVYPLLTIFAAFFAIKIFIYFYGLQFMKRASLKYLCISIFLLICSLWTVFFMQIYLKPHVKFAATEWIIENIPSGSNIAVEHWDDVLPVYGGENYNYQTLALYDPDTKEKWININNQLAKSDYIIIASNRLHTPLSKLIECEKLPKGKCYVKTAQYYEKLFAGKLGFEKVADFKSYPTIPILNIEINDQSADESFTVYDHPKVIIFKRK